jgi:hypothetical protein
MGAVVTPLGPAAFGEFIRADLKAWADFVAESRIKVE